MGFTRHTRKRVGGEKMKKRVMTFGMILVFLLTLVPVTQVFGAESENQYKSNGEVSFYGEYIYPSEPDKEKPPISGNGASNLPDTGKTPQQTLPQAGDRFEVFTLFLGICLIGLAGQVVYYLTKKNNIAHGGKIT